MSELGDLCRRDCGEVRGVVVQTMEVKTCPMFRRCNDVFLERIVAELWAES
jgi:hypothetical protein